MRSIIRALKYAGIALLLVPTFAFAKNHASKTDPLLSNSQEPGSVIVFPYFKAGTVAVSGTLKEQTDIHIGVTCPSGVTCDEDAPIKLEAHWVCPGSEEPASSFVCPETNFVLFTTVNGKITVTPNGTAIVGSKSQNIPVPDCLEGYLIAFVVNISDQPIKYDGLIGDATVRLSGTALSAYNGVPIQAADTNPAHTGNLITLGTDPNTGQSTLIFDGLNSDYALVTGQLSGDVKFQNFSSSTNPLLNDTFIVLLTLDVQSNFPNNPTFVGDFVFYNANQLPTSTATNFVCWQKAQIATFNAGLTQSSQGTEEGSFVTGQAFKVQISGISDSHGPATLLGVVITTEDSSLISLAVTPAREYITQPFNNSVGVATTFGLD